MAKTVLGKVGLNPRGEYSSTTEYNRLDLTAYNGSSFIALKDGLKGVTPFADNVNYMLLAKAGTKGDVGTVDNIDSINIAFTEAAERVNINTGETFAALFGKIRKWFSSLKALAFKDKVDWDSDIENRPSIPAKVSQLTNDKDYQTATQVATAITNLVNGSPEALDTLQELADALGNDPNFSTTILTKIGAKADKTTLAEALVSIANTYVPKEAGKGLSTNDLTDELKAYLTFMTETQSQTSVKDIPSTAASTEISIAANEALSILAPENLKACYVMTIRINNTATAARTITLPSSATWTNDFGTTLSIPASGRAEVSIWCYKEGCYSIRVGEVS